MAHFTKLDDSNIVTEILVIDNALLLDESSTESEALGVEACIAHAGSGTWVQTSYNLTFRKNYACIGDTYDAGRDAFIAPKSHPSWILDESTCIWHAPLDYPPEKPANSDCYVWDERIVNWVPLDLFEL